jgi:hypothetical protein
MSHSESQLISGSPQTATIRGIPKTLRKSSHSGAKDQHQQGAGIAEKAAGTPGGERKGPVMYHDLDHFAGLWAKEEAAVFDKALDAQRKVDEDLWKRTK